VWLKYNEVIESWVEREGMALHIYHLITHETHSDSSQIAQLHKNKEVKILK
jgi:hypothetical protein